MSIKVCVLSVYVYSYLFIIIIVLSDMLRIDHGSIHLFILFFWFLLNKYNVHVYTSTDKFE